MPFELMVVTEARRLRVGDYLPMQRRFVARVETDKKAGIVVLVVVTSPPNQPDAEFVHRWRPTTPVMVLPGPIAI